LPPLVTPGRVWAGPEGRDNRVPPGYDTMALPIRMFSFIAFSAPKTAGIQFRDIPVLSAGGTANHVHFLTALPATIALAKAVQILKANSSRWTRISEGSVPGTSVPGFHMPPLRAWSICPSGFSAQGRFRIASDLRKLDLRDAERIVSHESL
jgi:hypothetical protein